MPPGASGCTIMKLEPTSEAAKVLQVADVIMEVEGVPIAADESIPFRYVDMYGCTCLYTHVCLCAWEGVAHVVR